MDRVIAEALELPPEERRHVAERLLESMPEDDVKRAWLDEAELRKERWDAGLVVGVEGDDVIRGLRDRARS